MLYCADMLYCAFNRFSAAEDNTRNSTRSMVTPLLLDTLANASRTMSEALGKALDPDNCPGPVPSLRSARVPRSHLSTDVRVRLRQRTIIGVFCLLVLDLVMQTTLSFSSNVTGFGNPDFTASRDTAHDKQEAATAWSGISSYLRPPVCEFHA